MYKRYHLTKFKPIHFSTDPFFSKTFLESEPTSSGWVRVLPLLVFFLFAYIEKQFRQRDLKEYFCALYKQAFFGIHVGPN